MGKTDDFRATHKELLNIAKDMSGMLQEDSLGKDASSVRQLLSKLSGKLMVHLATEDRSLYPHLLSSQDSKLKEMAQKYMDEMGGIAAAFKGYVSKWPHAMAIQKAPADFIEETKGVFDALAKRIEREDDELYTLVDNS